MQRRHNNLLIDWLVRNKIQRDGELFKITSNDGLFQNIVCGIYISNGRGKGVVSVKAMNKGVMIAIIAVIALSFLCSPVFAAEAYGPAHEGDLTVVLPGGGTQSSGTGSPDMTISPGVKITLSGGGFAPRAKYDILWDGRVLIDPYADDNGYASYQFTVPSSAGSGIHTVSMQGPAESGGTLVLSSNISVKADKAAGTAKQKTSKATSFPYTGGGWLLYVLISGIAFIIIGFGTKLIRRAR